MNWIARAQSIAAGHVAGGLTILLALPPLWVLRRLQEPADRIAGRRAGTRGSCAAATRGLTEGEVADYLRITATLIRDLEAETAPPAVAAP